MKRRLWILLCFVFLQSWGLQSVFASPELPGDYILFKNSYPDIKFSESYDEKLEDWKIEVSVPLHPGSSKRKTAVFYWAGAKLLPKDQLKNKKDYTSLFYVYEKKIRDPRTFTKAEIADIKKFSSADNRLNNAGTPMFFFDFVYSADSKEELLKHTTGMFFLDKETRVHERIKAPLKRVDEKIKKAAKTDSKVKNFIKNLKSTDAYYWRIIAGTNRKSFHSYGIAVDVLPKSRNGKEIFWGWTKEKVGDAWITTRLSARWMPPDRVIKIFESEGFLWGGKWAIWDNMHFEYRPEMLKWNGISY